MEGVETAVVLGQLVATAAMVGLIWFVQLVHYPLFVLVGSDGFVRYEEQHQRRTAWVVGPLMGLEGITALALVIGPPPGVGRALPLVGLALLGVIHASTVFLQVPAHRALSSGFDAERVRHLVRTNWIRTAGWTARIGVAFAIEIAWVQT